MVVEVDVKTLLTNDWIVIRASEEGKNIRESKVTDQMNSHVTVDHGLGKLDDDHDCSNDDNESRCMYATIWFSLCML